MTQLLSDDEGVTWTCDYEPPAVGTRGVIVFVSQSGERRCHRTFRTLGQLVQEQQAD